MLGNADCHTTHEKKYLRISLLCLFPLPNNIQSSGEIQQSVMKYVTAKRKSLEYKTYLGNVIYFHLQLNYTLVTVTCCGKLKKISMIF